MLELNTEVFNRLENIKPITLKDHQRRATNLNKIFKDEKIKSFRSYKKILKLIEQKYEREGTRCGYYSTLIKYLDLTNPKSKTRIALGKLMKTCINKTKETGYIDNTHLTDVKYKEGKEELIKYLSDEKNMIDSNLLFFSLYILLSPRRASDYIGMKYTEDKSIITNTDNFMYYDKDNQTYDLIFNKYKTAKKYGTQIIRIENELMTNVIDRMNFKQNDLIYNRSGRQASRVINDLSERYFNKSLGFNDIRKLHSTNLFGKMKKELEKDAYNMGHSVNMKLNTYILN